MSIRPGQKFIRVAGEIIGYIIPKPFQMWAGIAYGKHHMPPPLFTNPGLAMAFVRRFGRPLKGDINAQFNSERTLKQSS